MAKIRVCKKNPKKPNPTQPENRRVTKALTQSNPRILPSLWPNPTHTFRPGLKPDPTQSSWIDLEPNPTQNFNLQPEKTRKNPKKPGKILKNPKFFF